MVCLIFDLKAEKDKAAAGGQAKEPSNTIHPSTVSPVLMGSSTGCSYNVSRQFLAYAFVDETLNDL